MSGVDDPLELGVVTWFLPVRGPAAVRWAHEHGFGCLHLDQHDVTGRDIGAVHSLSSQLGVSLAGLSAVALESVGLRGGRAIGCVESAIVTASALGINYVYLPAFGAAEISGAEDVRAMADLLRHAVIRGKEHGITIATENTLGAAEMMRLFELVDDDGVDLLFDTQNLTMRGIDPLSVIAAHRHRIRRFVHVKDGTTRCGNSRIGTGLARVAGSVSALNAAGFQGIYVLESDYRRTPARAPTDDRSRLCAMIKQMTAAAPNPPSATRDREGA